MGKLCRFMLMAVWDRVDAGVMRYPAIFAILYYERVTKGVEALMQEHN